MYDRKFLYKHFGIIKTFAQDIFGNDVELDFKKEEPSVLEEKKVEETEIEEKYTSYVYNDNELVSMNYDVDENNECHYIIEVKYKNEKINFIGISNLF